MLTAVCHYGFLFFSISAIYLSCSASRAAFIFSVISNVIAMFCLSGAVLAAIIGFGIQVYLKRPFRAVLMMILAIALIGLNHLDSQKASLGLPLIAPADTFTFFFLFLGSFFSASSVHLLSPLAGQLIIMHLFYITIWKKYYRMNLRLYSMFIFMILLAAFVSIFRANNGLPEAISSRYKIYSLLTLAITYLTLWEVVSESYRKRIVLAAICISAAFFVLINCRYYPAMVFCKEAYDGTVQSWAAGGKTLNHPDHERADRILMKSKSLGIYKP